MDDESKPGGSRLYFFGPVPSKPGRNEVITLKQN